MEVYVSSVPHGGPDSGCCRFCDPEEGACKLDDSGFHVALDERGHERRTTRRDGRDAYAYSCIACGTVGDIDEGRFVPRQEKR